LRWFDCVLDSGRLMGDRYQRLACTAAFDRIRPDRRRTHFDPVPPFVSSVGGLSRMADVCQAQPASSPAVVPAFTRGAIQPSRKKKRRAVRDNGGQHGVEESRERAGNSNDCGSNVVLNPIGKARVT
jgi:hypothetical protein